MKRITAARLYLPSMIVSATGLLCSCEQDSPQLPLKDSVEPIQVTRTVETALPDLYGVWGTSPTDLIAVGAAGMALHFDGDNISYKKCATRLDLIDIWGVSTSDVYAVSRSEIFHFDGSDWRLAHTEPGAVLHAIWGSSADDVYVVGDDGIVLHFDGNGWIRINLRLYALRSVFGLAPDDIYVVGHTSGYFHFNGTRWRFYPLFDESHDFTDVWASSPDDIYFAGADGVYRYDGTGTERIFLGNCIDFVGRSPDDMYVMTAPYRGDVYHFDGTGWEEICAHSNEWQHSNYLAMAATGEGHLAAVGNMGDIKSFDGTGWITINEASDNWFFDLYGLEDGTVYAAGDYDVLIYDGVAWESISGSQRLDLRAIWASAPDDVWGVGSNWDGEGFVRRFNGSDWTEKNHISWSPRKIWGLSRNNIYLVTWDGLVHYDGFEWSELFVEGSFGRVQGIWGTGDDNICAVGEGGLIQRFDGNEWKQVYIASDQRLHDVWGGASGVFYAVGSNGTIVRISGDRATLEPSGTTAHLISIDGTSTGEMCAVGGGPTVLLFNGDNWFPVETDIGWDLWGVWYIDNTVFIGGSDGLLLRLTVE